MVQQIIKVISGTVIKQTNGFILTQKGLISSIFNKVISLKRDPVKAILTALLRTRK